jgi:hypothetical protein
MKISDVFKLVPGPIKIEKVRCQTTGVAVEAPFTTPGILQLTEEQFEVVESLILNAGNLKKVAEDIGISYPTLRHRLDEIILILRRESDGIKNRRQEILDKIEQGTITPEKGAELLESL